MRFLETSGKNLRLELSFDSPISDVEEHILLGEGMPTEKIVQFGTRAKISALLKNFFSFSQSFTLFINSHSACVILACVLFSRSCRSLHKMRV